jgi:hypothetical protein
MVQILINEADKSLGALNFIFTQLSAQPTTNSLYMFTMPFIERDCQSLRIDNKTLKKFYRLVYYVSLLSLVFCFKEQTSHEKHLRNFHA